MPTGCPQDLVFNDLLFRLAWRARRNMSAADRAQHRLSTCAFCCHPTDREDQWDFCESGICEHSFAAHCWGTGNNRCLVPGCGCGHYVDLPYTERRMRAELVEMQSKLARPDE